jgi:hypothetical protein
MTYSNFTCRTLASDALLDEFLMRRIAGRFFVMGL